MALPKIFKEKEGKKKAAAKEEKKEVKKQEPKAAVAEEKKEPKKAEKKQEVAFKVLAHPHVTEKAMDLAGQNQYVFRVFSPAGKQEVKEAVQEKYGVDVTAVRILRVKSKKTRLGKYEGIKKGYKKAVVKIKEGQHIEILPQ